MPMQPSPMAETSKLLFPSLRFFIFNSYLCVKCWNELTSPRRGCRSRSCYTCCGIARKCTESPLPAVTATIIYNHCFSEHDDAALGETSMPRASQPQEIKIMATKSKAKKSAPKKKTA